MNLKVASVNPPSRSNQNTFVHTRPEHTHTLYLSPLVIVDDVNPHSSRMGMRWCHGLLLWDLETPAGHNPSHRPTYSLRSLNLNYEGYSVWSLVKDPTECLRPKQESDRKPRRPRDPLARHSWGSMNRLNACSLLPLFLLPQHVEMK